MSYHRFLLSVLLLSLSTVASATDWQVIRHPYFNLIFDATIRAEASRTADQLSMYLEQHLDELPVRRGLPATDIVLMNDAHIANGSVGLFPYRSRWYNKPAPIAQLEWFDVLAVHEGRHIVQFNQSRDLGWSRLMSVLFGEIGTGAVLLLLPDWYLEGDATVSETTLTSGGRGRVASFDLWYRTDLLTQAPYDYERAMLGTGFDRLPYIGPYVLGYFFTGYLRTEYGEDIFDPAIDDIGSGSTFNAAIRQRTGKDLDTLYDEMLNALSVQWQRDMSRHTLTKTDRITETPDDNWTSHYPVAISAQDILAIDLSVTRTPGLVKIQDNSTTPVLDIPNSVSGHYQSGSKTRAVTAFEDRVCWILDRPHPSHPFRSYGDIQCASGNGIERLTDNDKLTSVTAYEAGLIAHRFDAQRNSWLVWFDWQGIEQQRAALPTHSLAFDLKVQDDQLLYVLSGSAGEDGIYQWSWKDTDAPSRQLHTIGATLRAPLLTEHWLIYTSDQTGTDQLMAQHRQNGRVYQIASRPYGAYYPLWQPAQARLIFGDYQSQGMRLAAIPFADPVDAKPDWIPSADLPDRKVFVSELIPQTTPQVTRHNWTIDDYSVAGNLWNPYSWMILTDLNRVSAAIHSQDTLSKLSLSANVGGDLENRSWSAGLGAEYRLEAGPRLGTGLLRTPEQTDLSATLTQPLSLQWTHATSQLHASVGATRHWRAGGRYSTLATFSASADYVRQRAMQAIETPFGIAQSIDGFINTRTGRVSTLSNTQLTLAGWHSRQALNTRLAAQWLNDDTPLLTDSPLFATPDNSGLSLQADVDYRINLGTADAGFGPVVYWRHTELAFHGRAQASGAQTETALGVSLSPNLALLRSNQLTARPKVSLYYLPESNGIQLTFEVSLASF